MKFEITRGKILLKMHFVIFKVTDLYLFYCIVSYSFSGCQ